MKIRLLGVPMDLGAGRRGVDMGPSAIRIAGITEKLSVLGHTIIDDGDILIKAPEMQKIKNHRLKYFPEIVRACNLLAKKIEKTLAKKQFPLVLGGDHSIAMGTIAGISSYCKKHNKTLGVLWIDAHGDMNTDKTSPSGNIHGMPLAASMGLGADELISIGGSFTKVEPSNVALIAIRELDEGEKTAIIKNKVNIFTMEDIDKQGMADVMQKALQKLRNVDFLHVSFDLDSIDPQVAPGVGTPPSTRGNSLFERVLSIFFASKVHARTISGKYLSFQPK